MAPFKIGQEEEDPTQLLKAGKGADGMAIADAAMGFLSAGAPLIKNIGMSKGERMDEKGAITHKVNTGANTLNMAAAGAKLGSVIPGVGTAVGAVGGAAIGLGASLIDANQQPSFSDTVAENNKFNMQQMVQGIASNDTFIQQSQAAADGLKDVSMNKQVEVEKDEIVLRKTGSAFTKVADFKGGKSHAKGGEEYTAQEGDIIIPGKKRLQVDKALRTRDWKRIESIRQQLPTDNGQSSFKEGTASVDPAGDRDERWNAFLAQPGVKAKIQKIADSYGFTPEELMTVMDYETGYTLDPSKVSGNSSATGLIQFMPTTAEELGTSTEDLSAMTVLEQLDYVDKYFKKNHKKGDHPYDTVVAPSAAGKGDDTVLYPAGSKQAKANPSWQDEEGKVTKASARKAIGEVKPFEAFHKPTTEEEIRKVIKELPENKREDKLVLKKLGLTKTQMKQNLASLASDPNAALPHTGKSVSEKEQNKVAIDDTKVKFPPDPKSARPTSPTPAVDNSSTIELDPSQIGGTPKDQREKGVPINAGIKAQPSTIDTGITIPNGIELKAGEKKAGEKKTIGKTGGEGKVLDKIGGSLENLASYAPAIYNIVKGLESPEKIARRFITPQTKEYRNLSQVQLNLIDDAYQTSLGNARNTSGGLMSNFRANTEKAWADKIARTAQVNAMEAGRSDQIANENIGIRNQAEQYNAQVNAQADQIDMQSKAATNSFLAQGIKDVADITSRNKMDRQAEKNQGLMAKMIGSGRPYTFDPVTGEIKFNNPTQSMQTPVPNPVEIPKTISVPIDETKVNKVKPKISQEDPTSFFDFTNFIE
jgi:hypothetical protein